MSTVEWFLIGLLLPLGVMAWRFQTKAGDMPQPPPRGLDAGANTGLFFALGALTVVLMPLGFIAALTVAIGAPRWLRPSLFVLGLGVGAVLASSLPTIVLRWISPFQYENYWRWLAQRGHPTARHFYTTALYVAAASIVSALLVGWACYLTSAHER